MKFLLLFIFLGLRLLFSASLYPSMYNFVADLLPVGESAKSYSITNVNLGDFRLTRSPSGIYAQNGSYNFRVYVQPYRVLSKFTFNTNYNPNVYIFVSAIYIDSKTGNQKQIFLSDTQKSIQDIDNTNRYFSGDSTLGLEYIPTINDNGGYIYFNLLRDPDSTVIEGYDSMTEKASINIAKYYKSYDAYQNWFKGAKFNTSTKNPITEVSSIAYSFYPQSKGGNKITGSFTPSDYSTDGAYLTFDSISDYPNNGNLVEGRLIPNVINSLSASNVTQTTSGLYEKILENGNGNISFNKDITFSNNNFKTLERIYIPSSAVEATIVFTNESKDASNHTEIYSKFGAVSNYIDLYSPFQHDNENLLAMGITTRMSGKNISYKFNTDMLKRYFQHGEWLYFIIKQTEGSLNISYDVNVNLQSDIDKYNFNIWSYEIKNSSTNDDAKHIVVRKDFDTVEDYIFEDDFNSSQGYMSIHDIRSKNGNRGLKAHAESEKLTNYIKHTYHVLINQKMGVGTNKFKAYIPKNSSVNLYIATKPIDGDIALRIIDGANEVFNGTMKNYKSYKIENTGSTARWLKIDMARIGNQNLGVIFEYTAKYSSRPVELDGIKGDPQ